MHKFVTVLTPAAVQLRVNDFKAIIEYYDYKDIDGTCNSMEDGIYFELVSAIAHGECEEPVQCALIAPQCEDIAYRKGYT